jgi:TrmH family RNA methyltransferase
VTGWVSFCIVCAPASYDKQVESTLQSRVVVVLVRARNPSNIGAVARAMHDFGFSHLRVVNPYEIPFEAAVLAEKAAVHSSHILQSATQSTSLAEAVADCTLILGTTAVGSRVLEHPLQTIRDAAATVGGHLAADANARVALLFGSEKTGLSNDDLSHCHELVTIPMNPLSESGHLSMNLGQAAAVCLYELSAGVFTLPRQAEDQHATADDLERLTTLFRDVMEETGYTRRYPANAREASVRRVIRRMALSPDDASMWTGLLRQLLRVVPASSTASATGSESSQSVSADSAQAESDEGGKER